jgi:two-component system nitrogen regulation response regulator GlnG
VRELESTLKQMILQAGGPVLVQDDLPAHMRNTVRTDSAPLAVAGAGFDVVAFVRARIATGSSDLYTEVLVQVETFLLREVLRQTSGNQAQAAKILGIARNSLRKKISQLGITIGRVVDAADEQC